MRKSIDRKIGDFIVGTKEKKKILIIAGPTAVGKTSASIVLAKELNGEIVSADSMQIYKGLDIGTAKPTFDEMQGVPHYMIDVCEPSCRFSVAQYVKMADEIVEDILLRGKTPIIVGGTGLYIDNLIYSNDFGELDIDLEIRNKLTEESRQYGNEELLKLLSDIDLDYASRLHVNDTKRIIHALEIFYSTGKTQTQIINESRIKEPKYDFYYAVLNCSRREVLYDRINLRVDSMMSNGLLDEARRVITSEWYENSTAAQAIGYKEFVGFFNGTDSLEKCTELLKQHSRNYAKRQLTWFRHNKDAEFYIVDTDSIASVIGLITKDFSERK